MKHRVGIIAEDDTDIEVVRELIKKIARGKLFDIKKFSAYGCGKLIGKCYQWAVQLKAKGCDLLIVVHDLDDKQETKLRQSLEGTLKQSPITRRVIVIPVKEIEAWLLSDHLAIQKAMNLSQKVSRIPNPEALADPKRRLGEIIFLSSGKVKHYLTKDNYRIAQRIDLANLKRCPSFAPFEVFIRTYLD